MTDTLTRAANAASVALGMKLRIYLEEADALGLVGLPGQSPERGTCPIFTSPNAALAYLEGLETGARIMRERHARLRRAADDTYLWCCTYAQDFRLTDICQSLKAALANLED